MNNIWENQSNTLKLSKSQPEKHSKQYRAHNPSQNTDCPEQITDVPTPASSPPSQHPSIPSQHTSRQNPEDVWDGPALATGPGPRISCQEPVWTHAEITKVERRLETNFCCNPKKYTNDCFCLLFLQGRVLEYVLR